MNSEVGSRNEDDWVLDNVDGFYERTHSRLDTEMGVGGLFWASGNQGRPSVGTRAGSETRAQQANPRPKLRERTQAGIVDDTAWPKRAPGSLRKSREQTQFGRGQLSVVSCFLFGVILVLAPGRPAMLCSDWWLCGLKLANLPDILINVRMTVAKSPDLLPGTARLPLGPPASRRPRNGRSSPPAYGLTPARDTTEVPKMQLLRTASWLLAGAILLVFPAAGRAGDTARRVDFNRQIRPILSEACYQCHGPDQNKRKAELRLDLREGLFRSADGTTIVVPGKPDESELLSRISSDDADLRMPPPKHAAALEPEQIDLIERWISEGAEWKGHWAYIPPSRPRAPETKRDRRAAGEIDRFVRAGVLVNGLEPSAPADKRTLIRRLSFDLLGLPPTPAEVLDFERDTSSYGYERLIDRLMASPHFGERMAIFWLDLVRFADTTGYHGDNHVDIYLFRDYVIRSFNTNKPFDRFTVEQLAGDLVESPTDETRIASGYNRLLLTTQEGGAQAKEYMAKYSADRVRNVSTVWLGSTMGCCECHDHKYDPFKTREFYSMAAFFVDIKETVIGVQEPTEFPNEEQAREEELLGQEIAPLKAIKAPSGAEKRKLAELQKRLTDLRKQIPTTLISTRVEPRVMRVLPRGNWLNETGEVVLPGVPESLPVLAGANKERATRLDLARWLVSRQNPLPARVMVNRLWKLFFGQGLVTTMDDFGSQGALPSHPELLDWLASEFTESGWDVKAMIRKMVMSETYRQSSSVSEERRMHDPGNRWLAHQSRFRLDAELVRDNALFLSGLFCDKIGGRSVKPYQPPGYWVFLNFPKRDWTADQGQDRYRRGLYTYWQRMFLHPSLLAFDASTREECVVERPRSNTPLQALVLLNDPTYVEAARAFAARMIREGGAEVKARIERGFQLALARAPRGREVPVLIALLEQHYDQFRADPAAAGALLATGLAPPPPDIDPVELAAWTSVARVLLNLQETASRS
jgi:Protein of unknown function (DUF1553)/Protein of unknown function (DUF1549)/Planctomycete cytochrome C